MSNKIGLSWFVVALVGLQPGISVADDDRDNDPARAFSQGKQRFSAGDYLGAIESFEEAHRLRPHHSVLCNIALCFERQGDFVTAAAKYRDCLGKGGAQSSGADAIRNSLKRASARVGWAQVQSPGAGGTVYLDAREIGEAPQRLPLNPGNHVIEVRRAGADPATKTVTTRGGEQLTLVLQPRELTAGARATGADASAPAQASKRGLSSAWFWTMLGVTAALATSATVLGVTTLSLKSDYEENPTEELRDKGLSRRLVTNVLWGVTAAAAAATTTLYFFTDFHRERRASSATAGRRSVALGIGLRGRF